MSATAPDKKTTALASSVLEAAAVESSGFQPPMRATVDFLVGYTYERVSPAKAKKYLDEAYAISRHLQENEAPGLDFLQGELIQQIVRVEPQVLEESLPQQPELRDIALHGLIDHYVKTGNIEKATGLFREMQTEPEIDLAAVELMMNLTDKTQERASIFAGALRVYEDNFHPYITIGDPEDMGSLTVRFWRDLPPKLVREAIDELLRQADPSNIPEKSQARKAGITASSPTGTVTFDNLYEFRLFQVIPILRKLDPVEADALTQEANSISGILNKYPDGQSSFDPSLRDTPPDAGESKQTQYAIGGSGVGSVLQSQATSFEITRQIDQINSDGNSNPEMALSEASAIADIRYRIRALFDIAQAANKNERGTINSALQQVVQLSKKLDPPPLSNFLRATDLYQRIGNTDGAQGALKEALTAAQELYRTDSNPDDPNLALKLYWPSTQAWRDIATSAARISPEFALQIVKDVPDNEIKALENIFLAGLWMEVSPWNSTSPLVVHKSDLK